MEENKNIIENSKNKKWIMCDYYDTLVMRDCHPDHIKVLWSAKMAEEIEYSISGNEILEIRQASEMALSEKYGGLIKRGYDYHQLCVEMYDRLLSTSKLIIKDKWNELAVFEKNAFDCEVAIEKKHQFPIKERCAILKKLKTNGKKIILVSDLIS